MTKKSQGRIAKDRAKKAAILGTAPQPQVRVQQHRPANLGAFKPSENGGFKLTAADRILSDCKQGLGLVPSKQKNTCWDDLMEVYREAAGMLYRHTMVSQLLADQELISLIGDKETFNLNVKQFATDLGQINKELNEILGQHQGKTGGSEDTEEVLASFAIYEQYKLWMTRHDGVIKPTVMHILEQTNAAELLRAQARAAAAAQYEAEQASQTGLLNAEVPAEQLDAGVVEISKVGDIEFDAPAAEAVNTHAKPIRGLNSPIYQIDEAGFGDITKLPGYISGEQLDAMKAEGVEFVQTHAHHPQHHKHEHNASA